MKKASQRSASTSCKAGRPLTVGLVYDLRDDYLAKGFTEEQVAEFDSAATIAALEQTLGSLGFTVERVGCGLNLAGQLAAGKRWDLVFNFAEGLHGRSREAQVPCLLEMYEIPYTFSDPLVCALTLDKAMTKRMIQSAGLHTPRFVVVRSSKDIESVDMGFPLFAKPLAEGTGKGVDEHSRIDSPEALRRVCVRLLEHFRQPVLVEEYLPGREFTTAILGTGSDAAVVGPWRFRFMRMLPQGTILLS
jgi:D-alanine-D-alanine ligase